MENVYRSVNLFKQLKFRQQIIFNNRKILIINDSKSTSFSSSRYLLESYTNIYWIVGGLPKKNDKFTLNKGHVMFFYDKGEYLSKRYDALREEMINRGMKPDDTRVFKRDQWPDGLYNDWMPTVEDQNIVRKRIEERISQKPNWYRLTTNENK